MAGRVIAHQLSTNIKRAGTGLEGLGVSFQVLELGDVALAVAAEADVLAAAGRVFTTRCLEPVPAALLRQSNHLEGEKRRF